MPKLCRACQKQAAVRGGVCNHCRRRVLKDPVAPMLRPRIWTLAGLLVCSLSLTSSLIAGAVMTGHTFPLRMPWSSSLTVARHLPSGKTPVKYQIAMVVEQVSRKVFPYSIVPGGAQNLDEAKRAMRDPLVKANYANIDFSQLRQVKLTTNMSGYVSYRWGEKIYWTSKMLTLRAGETVFTDGVHLVRGRCLNCYSPRAMLPIRPNEPTEKVLDTPVEMPVIAYSFPRLPVEVPELPPPPGALTPTVPIFPAPTTPGKPGGGIWFPIIPIIPPIHRHPPSGPTPPGTPPIPPVTVVPEPSYVGVLAAAFLGMLLVYTLRRRTMRLPNLSTEKLQPGGTRVVEP
jgi:hypothetical protein